MQRRYLSIISATITAFALSAHIFAAEKKKDTPPDDFGCHLDEITDSYFCSSGPLEGREFLTKSELDDAVEEYKAKQKEFAAERPSEMLPPSPEAPKSPDVRKENLENRNLKIMSWNMQALAGDGSDYDRAAMVLGKADVIALQEVDLKGQGKGFLNVIGNLIQAKTQDRICRAWVQGANGERQTYGFLWKEKAVSLVEDGGGMSDVCGESATTIHQSKKMKGASIAMFYFKPQKKMFVLGTAFLDKKPKAPDKTMSEIFKSLDEGKWPIMLAGDLKLNANNSAFKDVRKLGFRSAVSGSSGKTLDNMWYRGATLKEGSLVDLYVEFSDVRKEDIKRDFSGIFPVMAEFSFKDENVSDNLVIVSKAKPAAVKKKSKKKN